MARLVLVDNQGGSLAALGAAMARVEGAPGFDEAVARSTSEIDVAPVVGEVLAEVGVHLVPTVKTLAEIGEHDVVVSIGDVDVPNAAASWSAELAKPGSAELVVRSTARIARDRLARSIAEFCGRRAPV